MFFIIQDQFIFIHDAVLEELVCKDTSIDTNEYSQQLTKFSSDGTFNKQFDLLIQVSTSPDSYCTDTASSHHDKNRTDKFLPRKLS